MTNNLFSTLKNRQKIIAIGLAVVLLIICWQIYQMFTSENQSPPIKIAQAPTIKPEQVQRISEPPLVSAEIKSLSAEEQSARQQYLDAVNQLQMLRIKANIAETTKHIAADKLEAATSEKKIEDLRGTQSQTMSVVSTFPKTDIPAPLIKKISYRVASVTETKGKWSAVISNHGILYHVRIGDALPEDGAKVVAIFKNGVTIEKDGTRKRILMTFNA